MPKVNYSTLNASQAQFPDRKEEGNCTFWTCNDYFFSCFFFSLLYQHCNCSLRVASSSERVGWKTCSIATACTNCRRRGKATWSDAPTWSFMKQHATQVHVSKSFASQFFFLLATLSCCLLCEPAFLPSLNLGRSILTLLVPTPRKSRSTLSHSH